MKSIIAALISFVLVATLHSAPPDPATPEGKKFLEGRRKLGEEMMKRFPDMQYSKSPIRKEYDRLYAMLQAGSKSDREFLDYLNAPTVIMEAAAENVETAAIMKAQEDAAKTAQYRANVEREAAEQEKIAQARQIEQEQQAEIVRRQVSYMPMPLEMPAQTAARVQLLKLRDKALDNGTLTPELELKIAQSIARIAAEAAQERAYSDANAEASVQQSIQNAHLFELEMNLRNLRRQRRADGPHGCMVGVGTGLGLSSCQVIILLLLSESAK